MTSTATGWAELGFGPGLYVQSASKQHAALRDPRRHAKREAGQPGVPPAAPGARRPAHLPQRDGDDFRRLAGEWLDIRDTQVRPLVREAGRSRSAERRGCRG